MNKTKHLFITLPFSHQKGFKTFCNVLMHVSKTLNSQTGIKKSRIKKQGVIRRILMSSVLGGCSSGL